MMQIRYSVAFKNLDAYIDSYNERTKKAIHKIKSAATLTAKEVIRIYGVYLLKADSVQTGKGSLPPLRTNNQQLAKLVKCSPRSIQRHLARLLQAKILLKKVWHGSNASYELWINPEILFGPVSSSDQENLKTNQIQSIKNISTTICPHTYPTGYINNIIIPVEMCKTTSTADRDQECRQVTEQVTGLAGHTEEHGTHGKNRAEENGDSPGMARAVPFRGGAGAADINFYVELLWTFARNVLYRDTYITAQQETIAKKHLQAYYEPVEPSKLSTVHEIYLERIALVAKFLKKDPNRYVQLPHRYFDINNKGGFARTKEWWQKFNHRRKELQLKLILHAQVRKYFNNLKKDFKARRPQLEVYRECEQRLGKLGSPLLVEEFKAMVLNRQAFQKLNAH